MPTRVTREHIAVAFDYKRLVVACWSVECGFDRVKNIHKVLSLSLLGKNLCLHMWVTLGHHRARSEVKACSDVGSDCFEGYADAISES